MQLLFEHVCVCLMIMIMKMMIGGRLSCILCKLAVILSGMFFFCFVFWLVVNIRYLCCFLILKRVCLCNCFFVLKRAYSDRDQSELEFQVKVFDAIINGKIENVDFLHSVHNTVKHLDALDPPSIRNGKYQLNSDELAESKKKQNDRFAYYLTDIYKNVSQTPLLFLIFFDSDGFKDMIKDKPLSHHCIDYDGNDTETDGMYMYMCMGLSYAMVGYMQFDYFLGFCCFITNSYQLYSKQIY